MTKGHPSSATDDHLSAPEVRQRAVIGAVVDALRGIGIRVVGLLGTAVTARLLTPYDFGLVAFGATILVFGSYLSDGGVGTALIRRAEPPDRSELQALVGFQLGLDLLLVLGTAIVMFPFGLLGQVTTVVVVSLPFGAVRAPAYIIYERRLNYRPMAIVELAETTAYYVWAIVTISLGWGVWGLATAAVVRATLGSTLLLALLPQARVLPVPSYTKIQALLGFGFRYQAVGLLQLLRDQGVNVAVALVGGVAVLGLWSVAWRIIQIPYSFFVALWRVSFPGMSRLVAAGEEVGRHDRACDRPRCSRNRSAPRAARGFRLGLDTRAHWSQMGGGRLGDTSCMCRNGFRRAHLGRTRGLPVGDRRGINTAPCNSGRNPSDGANSPSVAPAYRGACGWSRIPCRRAFRIGLLRPWSPTDRVVQDRKSPRHPRLPRCPLRVVWLARGALDRTGSRRRARELCGRLGPLSRGPRHSPSRRPHRRNDARPARAPRFG